MCTTPENKQLTNKATNTMNFRSNSGAHTGKAFEQLQFYLKNSAAYTKKTRIHLLDQRIVRKQLDIMQSRENG